MPHAGCFLICGAVWALGLWSSPAALATPWDRAGLLDNSGDMPVAKPLAQPSPSAPQDPATSGAPDGPNTGGARLPKISLHDATFVGYTTGGNTVTINTSTAVKLRASIVTPSVVRLWATASGRFSREPGTAVVGIEPADVPHTVSDQGTYIRILTAALAVRINKAPLSVDFYQADDATPISREPAQLGSGWGDNAQPLVYRQLAASEHLYGLGQDNTEYLGRLERRGTVRTLWTGQVITRGKVTADYPIPLLLSTGGAGGGYGLFFDNTYRTVVDLGKATPNQLTWQAAGGDLVYYFIGGPQFAQILASYTELTGRMPLPPRWALGFIQSKCSYYNWAEIDDVVANMRSRQLPFDGMAIDFDWPEAMQNFRWNARWQGLSASKLQEKAGLGVKFYISDTGPMIRKDSSNYQDGLNHHIFATDGSGKTLTCGYYGGDLMDFTAPAMKEWLKPQLSPLVAEGIEGWWLDLSEPEGEPVQTVYQGGPAARIHNAYSLLSAATYVAIEADLRPDSRPFVLTRTGSAGIQRYGVALWSGDIYSDYETMAAQVPEALSSALSGVPLWSNDTGGFLTGYYKDNLADHGRLYERWLQFSTFTPVMRAHHVGLSAPYMFGADVEAGTRRYLQLRYRLLPYIYSYVWQTHQTGAPLMRPLVFEAQNDPQAQTISDEFFFGHELLVAPVLTENTTSRSVYLPAGTWIDYDTGRSFAGGQAYAMPAPQHHIPLLVRAGAIIPMAPDRLQYSDEKPWDPLTIDAYPDGDSQFTLYADDGQSYAYQRQGAYTQTLITSHLTPHAAAQLTITESNRQFTPKSYIVQLHLRSTPKIANWGKLTLPSLTTRERFDSATAGSFWDVENHTLYLRAPHDAGTTTQILVTLGDDDLGDPAL